MAKFCITFAAPIGSGKSPITNYLGFKLGLPAFNNDSIRTEVREDLLDFDQQEYEKRQLARARELVQSGQSFIYDASIDRKWEEFEPQLKQAGYSIFVISLDFSKELLTNIYKAKGYTEFEALTRTYYDHQKFSADFPEAINLHLTDSEFKNRLELSFLAVKKWIEVQ